MRKYIHRLMARLGFHREEKAPSEPQERRYSKYFIAVKKNQGDVLDTLRDYMPFLPPEKMLYADPMLFKWKGVNYMFFETYDYKKGIIDYVTIGDDLRFSERVTVMDFDCHLSFSALFEDEGRIYMTPETYSLNEVGLYEAADFPKKWIKKRVLVSGNDFTDPILFKLNGYYWLFTAVNTAEMCIYYAETLSSEFLPHPINTKKIPGRNAGTLFTYKGHLVRPVMDCSKIYGGAMTLNEIVELTPTSFVEKEIHRIDATWAPDLNGTHTFNMNEDLVVYDGRRSVLESEDALYSAPSAHNVSRQWEKIEDERAWIEKKYLPSCSGSMLYIGVGSYTAPYHSYTKTPELFETIDFMEDRAQHGSPFKHHVGDILAFQPDHLYDHVSFFGVLGFPIEKYAPFTTDASIRQVLEKIHSLVKIGGVLHIGANYGVLQPGGNYDEKEPYTIDFWMRKFEERYAGKYEIVSLGLSSLSILWVGKKVKD